MVRLLFLFFTLIVSTIGAFLFLLFFGVLNPYSKICQKIFFFWSFFILKASGLKLNVSGFENFDKSRGYILCSNHRHLLDIPILCVASRLNIRFAAKKELFRIPIFGQAIRLAGMVCIDRGKTKEAIKSLTKAGQIVSQKGVSLVIFPEGTRNKTGKGLLSFKKGAFMTAINTKQEILPAAVVGSDKIFKNGRIIPKTISVHFFTPIKTKNITSENRSELIHKVYQTILSKLDSSIP